MSLVTATARWRPALRMARRDLRTHRLRSIVVTLLVALPIAAAVTISTVAATTSFDSENALYAEYGAADLKLEVTPWPEIRANLTDQGRSVTWREARGLERTDRRVPSDVDVTALLPAGATAVRTGFAFLPLTTGGTLEAQVLDLDAPVTTGLVSLEQGRAPRAADEVALPAPVADELGLLDADGRLRADAVLTLVDVESLEVVGISDTNGSSYESIAVVPPSSGLVGTNPGDDLRGEVDTAPYLVDLPPMSVPEQQRLFETLAAAGVAGQFRDAALRPGDWGLPTSLPTPVDPTAVAVGALVIGLGLVEVLVLVGAVFAVGARRQSRTLGLVIASGGTGSDVRRTLLAQGLWIGLVAAALGVAGGAAALLAGRGLWERIVDTRLIEYDVSVGSIAALALLGVASAVLAAAIPAWGVGRMTAAQALDGQIATPTTAARDRLRGPALSLIGVGLLGLVACGFWIASTYADQTDATGTQPSAVPVVVAAVFALLTLVGTTLGIPSLVSSTARVTGVGWLPWRLATRDATRNRGRTTAAVLAIGIVTTGAVFAGFGVSAATAYGGGPDQGLPPDTAEIYLTPAEVEDQLQLARVEATVTEVLGADAISAGATATSNGRAVTVRRSGNVSVVDEAWLDIHQVPREVRDTIAAGGAAVSDDRAVRQGRVVLRSRGREGTDVAELDAVALDLPWDSARGTWISARTAAAAGLTSQPTGYLLAHAPGVTEEDAERIRLYGLFASVEYDGNPPSQRLVYAGAAGTLALTALVVGLVVALSAAEGRGDAATLASVGAPLWTRRAMSAAQALFVGGLGSTVGLLLGSAVGATTLQITGTSGTPVPWGALAVVVLGVPVLCAAVGWMVAPTRLTLTRRSG